MNYSQSVKRFCLQVYKKNKWIYDCRYYLSLIDIFKDLWVLEYLKISEGGQRHNQTLHFTCEL